MIAPAWLVEAVAEWAPRERLGGNAWAERERVLSKEESPNPGPWKSVPWQREVLDAFADPSLDWLVILKAAQMGVSELVRCAIGRWALLDPGDVLWVMTTEDAARKAMKKLRAMFRATPALRPLLPDARADATLMSLTLTTGMKIVIGWAGSAQSLASDPFRYVILDEVGKYRTSVQGEASPVDLAKERTKVYGRRAKIVLLSSPKHDDDLISTAHREVEDRRVFAAPCSDCGEVQPVDWSSVRWPGGEPSTSPTEQGARVALAREIEAAQTAWVECRSCKGRVHPHRAQYDDGAQWVQEHPEPAGRRRAYHVPEFWHWETTLSDLVAKFLRCNTPSALQGFFNGSMGTGYRNEQSLLEASLFAARSVHAPRVVPAWATTVLATADTQLRGWWYVVRAWGSGNRSRLLAWGWAEGTDGSELLRQTLDAEFPMEGRDDPVRPIALAIDAGGGMASGDGSRTQDVYRLAVKTVRAGRRIYPIKGKGDQAATDKPWSTTTVRLTGERFGGREVELYLLNRNFYADALADLVRATEPVLWEECRGAESPTYTRQMASEHKVLVSSAKGSMWTWQKRSKGAENHLFDCSRYQAWLAEFTRVEDRGRPAGVVLPAKAPRERPDARSGGEGWLIGRDG